MVSICLYFTYLGWRVIYFCSKASQMTQPKKYLKRIIDGCFLRYCIKKPYRENYAKESVEFEGGGTLQILNLTESKGRSPRCDVVLYDEEAEAEEDAYMAAESILDGSDIGLTIHASTPVKASKFEDNHDRLKLREITTGHELIYSRNYDEIYFLVDTPAKRAKYAEKKRTWPGWYFRQEYECSFELPSGAVFQNVIYRDIPSWIQAYDQTPLCSGVDWNPVAGHWLAGGRWIKSDEAFVIQHAINLGVGYTHQLNDPKFPSTAKIYSRIRKYFMFGKRLCVEDGGINIAYCDWLRERRAEDGSLRDDYVSYEEWDSAGLNKTNAVLDLQSVRLYVDELLFPELAKQVRDAHWKEDADKPELAKDKADSPHGLDALLHAVSSSLRRDAVLYREDW